MFWLYAHTYFSFHYGTLSPESLVQAAVQNNIRQLVLADRMNTSACFDFVRACRAQSIQPILGISFHHPDGSHAYTGIARNMQGFEMLNRLLSDILHEQQTLPLRVPYHPDYWIIYPAREMMHSRLQPHERIGFSAAHLKSKAWQIQDHRLLEAAVWMQPVTFEGNNQYTLHRLLQGIHQCTVWSKIQPAALAAPDHRPMHARDIETSCAPLPGLFKQTRALLDACTADFSEGIPKNRKSFTGYAADDRALLYKLAHEGFDRRYPNPTSETRKRLAKELEMIDQLGFSTYFLITWDMIRYAQSRGFDYVGRGSGANSIVAYCMQITQVDPIELDLYFERFINPHRSSPPDFDIDFSWNQRDQVIDYMFKRYGKEHTSLLATYHTFKARSVIRELGKVWGLPKEEIDRIIANPNAEGAKDQITRAIFHYGKMLDGFPQHLSIHAGGLLISEAPIYRYTATHLPPKGFSCSQFDMFVAEDMGLYKFDVLSQRGLGHIRDTIRWVELNRGISIDIHRVKEFQQDPSLNEKLSRGDTMGCFYIESPAMRQLLIKLRCADYRTLVAASSIIRPGVARSGMMKTYIQRHHHPTDFQYIHPLMKELMEETHGVMVYQEDVIKVAHHFGGLDLSEADILRRAMSGKYRSKDGFQRIRDRFFSNGRARGYQESVIEEVWRQMESFSGYSFSKAHSASFAVESYQSLYLKHYYPLEFMVSVINNFGGFYRTEQYLREAQRNGAIISAPCVNHGQWLSSLQGNKVILGMIHLRNLEEKLAKRILKERLHGGLYRDLDDFCRRIAPSAEQLRLLIQAGAFHFTGLSKKNLYWLSGVVNQPERTTHPEQACLFYEPTQSYAVPIFHDDPLCDAYDEIECFGFSIQNPFCMISPQEILPHRVSHLMAQAGKRIAICGYLITTKDVRTVHHDHMQFGTFHDADLRIFDTVHFPDSLRKYPLPGAGFYRIQGRVTAEYGVPIIEVVTAERCHPMPDPRHATPSRSMAPMAIDK